MPFTVAEQTFDLFSEVVQIDDDLADAVMAQQQ